MPRDRHRTTGLMADEGHVQVAYVEKDSIVHTMEDGELEKNSPWGLARISHRKSLSFGTFNKYLYSADGGAGVDVYVIDTGTNVDHVDFEGRANWGKTIPANDEDKDGNGHGTHCSGTGAGKKYGVAKKASVYAVKVLKSNGSGTMSDVVKGVEWAALSHIEKVKAAKKGKGKKGFKGSAANMSLGGGKSVTLDKAVNAAVEVGIHFAVAAGNDNADSCKYSPAAAENAVTVGASTLADERAYFSNYGKCNDIFAPGLNIQSTWIGSKYAVNTISGTSMASPHIAGLLAYFLSLQPAQDSAFAVAEITPKKLKANLISVATEGALSDVPSDTKNVSRPICTQPRQLTVTDSRLERGWLVQLLEHPARQWIHHVTGRRARATAHAGRDRAGVRAGRAQGSARIQGGLDQGREAHPEDGGHRVGGTSRILGGHEARRRLGSRLDSNYTGG